MRHHFVRNVVLPYCIHLFGQISCSYQIYIVDSSRSLLMSCKERKRRDKSTLYSGSRWAMTDLRVTKTVIMECKFIYRCLIIYSAVSISDEVEFIRVSVLSHFYVTAHSQLVVTLSRCL